MSPTPGPWTILLICEKGDDQYGPYLNIGHDCDPRPVCTVDLQFRERAMANARLLAAAPELLEALKATLAKGSRWHPADPVVLAARAALAKATGEAS